MMMKKITLLALTCFLSVVIHAQQLPQITQYMMNSYVVNPATAGMNDYYQVRTSIRNQWENGLESSPPVFLIDLTLPPICIICFCFFSFSYGVFSYCISCH